MSQPSSIRDARDPGSRRRRILVWAIVAVVVLIALIVTPPLVNANRLKKRIVSSMSESLGRPVHIDNVTVNLFPVPGFTLQTVVVSEDPSFGFEPVIRADNVRASIRVSSLWRRQVEFGTISFDSPSVNLVRRADGRWNLESILLRAAQESTAPTEQPKAGPAPRFPYIEATGARINVKLGDEKLPISLTETDFALWLPAPNQWKVRLEARPSRTNAGASDTGIVTVEATLRKADRLQDVPLDLTASWRNLPLGEATRILRGHDAGWRGAVETTASLHGTLGDGVLSSTLKITGLRRAEFIPAHPLDVITDCTAHMNVALAVLHEPTCTVSPAPISHIGFGAVASTPESAIYATADQVELTGLKATGVRIGTPRVSLAWIVDMARLWSQGTPQFTTPTGSASGSFVRVDSASGFGWQGELRGTVQATSLGSKVGDSTVAEAFTVSSDGGDFVLAPFNLTFADKTPLQFGATAGTNGMSLHLAGTGTPQQILFPGTVVPPLTEGFAQALTVLDAAASATAPAAPLKVDLTCTRTWGGEQTCLATRAAEPVRARPNRRRR